MFTKTKNSISLDSRFVDLENAGFPATLIYKLIIGCQCRQEMGKIPNFAHARPTMFYIPLVYMYRTYVHARVRAPRADNMRVI